MAVVVRSIITRKSKKSAEVSINSGVLIFEKRERNRGPEERNYGAAASFYVGILFDILGEAAFFDEFYCESCLRCFEVPHQEIFCPLCHKEF